MKISGVYWIRNIVNNYIYIGSSVDINGRIYSHEGRLCNSCHENPRLQADYDKYGVENFKYKVLITCHPDMLHWYEQQFLDQWKPEYNLYLDANGPAGYKHSEESKRNMSQSQKGNHNAAGHKMPVTSKIAMSEAHKGRPGHPSWNKGKKASEESRHNMSIAQKKRWGIVDE